MRRVTGLRSATLVATLLAVGIVTAGCTPTDGLLSATPTAAPTESPGVATPDATPNPGIVSVATVTNVVDGDTLDLSTGERVRLIGIDTPERGDCGYSEATALLSQLVLGMDVEVANPTEVEDYDAYGRALAYIAVPSGAGDAGRQLLAQGLAVPRYNSTDGYALHPFEADYAAVASAATPFTCAPAAPPVPAPSGQWTCIFDPTYDHNWHNDAWCTNGSEGHRPILREWDSHVTEAELMESAAEYARQLNGG